MFKRIISCISTIAIIGGVILFTTVNTYAQETSPQIVDSWVKMYHAEDSQIREMYEIYDTNISPSFPQRIGYLMTKPIVDVENALLGGNRISYGGGGCVIRHHIMNLFGM